MKNLLKKLNELAETVDLDQFYSIRMQGIEGSVLPSIVIQAEYNAELIDKFKADPTMKISFTENYINFRSGKVEFTFERQKP